MPLPKTDLADLGEPLSVHPHLQADLLYRVIVQMNEAVYMKQLGSLVRCGTNGIFFNEALSLKQQNNRHGKGKAFFFFAWDGEEEERTEKTIPVELLPIRAH